MMDFSSLKPILLLLFFLKLATVNAQQTSRNLVIKEKEIFVVDSNNALILDTLIMADKATIRFSPRGQGTLIVKTAIIGEDCLISSSGKQDFNGQNAGKLVLTMHFESLKTLTIEANGGNGKRGANGRYGKDGSPDSRVHTQTVDSNGKPMTITTLVPGMPGTAGTNGQPGGKAGNGGDISLTYGTSGFIINFNDSRAGNNIFIKNAPGIPGRPGKDGRNGRYADRGAVVDRGQNKAVTEADPAIPGKVVLNKIQEL